MRQCDDGYPSCRKAEAGERWCAGPCQATEAYRVLIEGDVEGFRRLSGCPARSAEIALHKARYERTDVPATLRGESGEWLRSRGYGRMYDLPWPRLVEGEGIEGDDDAGSLIPKEDRT